MRVLNLQQLPPILSSPSTASLSGAGISTAAATALRAALGRSSAICRLTDANNECPVEFPTDVRR